jgi:two-component system, LytTR family, response regulator
MSYTVLIVEDEKHAQQTLSTLLQEQPEFTVVGIASTIDEANTLVTSLKPNLVICDVMLPPHTSFEWLQTFDQLPFEIIFTTSFGEHAVKAFRLAAIDYLLKPVSREEFIDALEKFKARKQKSASAERIQHLFANLNAPPAQARIALPTLTGFLFVPIKDIVRCESDNTYTTFFTLDKRSIIVSKTLKECERMLTDFNFYRVHNSHLINLDYITEYIKGEGGLVKMIDGSHVDVSRRRKEEFLKQLKG